MNNSTSQQPSRRRRIAVALFLLLLTFGGLVFFNRTAPLPNHTAPLVVSARENVAANSVPETSEATTATNAPPATPAVITNTVTVTNDPLPAVVIQDAPAASFIAAPANTESVEVLAEVSMATNRVAETNIALPAASIESALVTTNIITVQTNEPEPVLVMTRDAFATNRLTLSARFGFNISGRFKGFGSSPRVAPDGLGYNYDDGYVHPDVSGDAGGQTWNWGYDDSASQIAGNTILLNRAGSAANPSSQPLDSGLSPGVELVYSREIGNKGKWHYGVEAAVNYLSVSLKNESMFVGDMTRVTDAYPFTPGTTPPSGPYQGSFNGPGFVIGDTPVSSVTNIISGATVTGQYQLDASVWGIRLGPWVERQLSERVNVSLSAGLAAALLNVKGSWTEAVELPGIGTTIRSGTGSDNAFLLGGYLTANAVWQFSDRWNLAGGVQYQTLGKYKHSFGSREAELDLSNSIFVTVGLGFRF
jgi:hypothetical protein